MSRPGAVNTQRAWLVAVACTLVSLAGCSTTFLYSRLDTLIPWYLRMRVTLEDRQIDDLRRNVGSLTSWHRRSQLTRYSDFLRDLSLRADRPTSRREIEDSSRRIEGYWRDVIVEFAPGASQWLQSLSAAQLEQLLASYAEDDEELDEDYCKASMEELARRRIESLQRSVRYWIGALTDEQEAILERTARELRRTDCEWIESRSRWRAELKAALLANTTRGEIDARVKSLLLDPRQTWTESYLEGFRFNRERILDMLVTLDATLNEKQRKAMVKRLTDLAEDLDALARRRA